MLQTLFKKTNNIGVVNYYYVIKIDSLNFCQLIEIRTGEQCILITPYSFMIDNDINEFSRQGYEAVTLDPITFDEVIALFMDSNLNKQPIKQ